jgi:selenoprotein W-related protein
LAAELLREFELEIEKLVLIPSTGGRFDVEVDGNLIFSKRKKVRHARTGEVAELVRNYLKERTT